MRSIFALTLVLCGVLLSGCGDESEDTEPGPVECEYLTLPDVAYPQETEFVDAPPEGTGGPLSDGDYELVAFVRYRAPGDCLSDEVARAALRLKNRGTVMSYVFSSESGEPENPKGFAGRVKANGNVLEIATVCPEMKTISVGYTASGDRISLFEDDEELRFERR
jgi:hypothetical protein